MTALPPTSYGNSQAPSGAQVELLYEDQSAVVVEVGGALRTYTIADRPLLEGYDNHEICSGARGQTLIPWPNRLRDGTYRHEESDHQLALTEPSKHNAIHGLVRWSNWSVSERYANRVVMVNTLFPQDGWPFMLDLSIDYQLNKEGLSVQTSARNIGTGTCPYGTGAHPYLTLNTATIDQLMLQAPGATRMLHDDRGIPIGTEAVDGTAYDFRTPRVLGNTILDTAFFELERDEAGIAHVELSDPSSGSTVRLWMDNTYQYLMLFTGDSLPDPRRRRRGFAVEPMTCAPNALQSKDGLRVLEPGQSLISTWGISGAVQTPQSVS